MNDGLAAHIPQYQGLEQMTREVVSDIGVIYEPTYPAQALGGFGAQCNPLNQLLESLVGRQLWDRR